MECIDHHVKVRPISHDHSKNATIFYPMELIYVSTLGAVAIPCEIYEAAVDATISAVYCCEMSKLNPDKTK